MKSGQSDWPDCVPEKLEHPLNTFRSKENELNESVTANRKYDVALKLLKLEAGFQLCECIGIGDSNQMERVKNRLEYIGPHVLNDSYTVLKLEILLNPDDSTGEYPGM